MEWDLIAVQYLISSVTLARCPFKLRKKCDEDEELEQFVNFKCYHNLIKYRSLFVAVVVGLSVHLIFAGWPYIWRYGTYICGFSGSYNHFLNQPFELKGCSECVCS